MEHYLIKVWFYTNGMISNTAKKYTYKVPKDIHLDIGDEVVVIVGSHNDQKHHVVRVTEVDLDARDNDFQYKWIVQPIDTVTYEDRLVQEKEFKQLVTTLMNRKKNKSLVDQLSEVASPEELERLKKYI